MAYDPDKHHRRSIRLKGHDYAQPGAYFVTICTRKRECLLGHAVNGEMRLNDAGEIARRCWEDLTMGIVVDPSASGRLDPPYWLAFAKR